MMHAQRYTENQCAIGLSRICLKSACTLSFTAIAFFFIFTIRPVAYLDRSRRCWISSFRFFATSRSDAPGEINLVLFAAFCRFYLASLVILIVLSLHTFPTRFRLCLLFRFRFLRPALLSLSLFPCSCSLFFFCPVSLFPVLSRFPSPCPVFCSVPSPSRLSRFPCPVSCPVSRLPPVSPCPVSLFVPCSVPSFFLVLCVRSSVRVCVRSFVRSFVRSAVRSFVRSFVRSCARPFVRSLAGIFSRFPCSSSLLIPPSPYFPSPSVLLSLLV